MIRAWRWWRELWTGDEPPWSLALVRILLATVFLADLAEVRLLRLVVPLWGPGDAGGMGDPEHQSVVPEVYRLFPPTVATADGLFWVLFGATFCVAIGCCTRAACVVAALAAAQTAILLPPADRGIDMLIRNVLWILAFAPSGRAWGVDAWLLGRLDRIPAWPRRLLVLQLAVMYFTAGIQKSAVAWWPWGGFSALYIVLQDMAVARIPFAWLQPLFPATQVLTAATIAFECLAVFVPLAFWFRQSRTRPGWWRAQFNRLGFVRLWLPLGLLMHLGIAATMQIGIFPWAMLALYPAFFHPDELEASAPVRWFRARR